MKRSRELTPLSHDHHQALFVAMQLKRADEADPSAALAAFLEYDERTGARHFEIEETILLPGWLAADPEAEADDAIRVLAEHLQIRAAAARLRAEVAPGGAELKALGELLERHVRYEERELFPRIEQRLDPTSLDRLGAAIAAAEGDAC